MICFRNLDRANGKAFRLSLGVVCKPVVACGSLCIVY